MENSNPENIYYIEDKQEFISSVKLFNINTENEEISVPIMKTTYCNSFIEPERNHQKNTI
jgi:hypothetical protein